MSAGNVMQGSLPPDPLVVGEEQCLPGPHKTVPSGVY